jgi:hypothetical protein
MKKFSRFLLVAVMVFAMALPVVAEENQVIYLKGSGSNFNETWNNTFKVTENVGENPNVWHIVYTGKNVNQITAMQLDFGDNGIWQWNPSMGFSTNRGGNNPGWVVLAPADWDIVYIDRGNNNNSNSFVVTTETGNINFNISGFHKGTPDIIKGELDITKHVEGAFIGEWFADKSDEEITEIIDSITFEVYAVDFDGDENLMSLVGLGFLNPDGYITFLSNEDGSNRFVPGWYAIIERLEGVAAEIFENEDGQVGPLYVYIGKDGVMCSISEPNSEGIFTIQHTGENKMDIKLTYDNGHVYVVDPNGIAFIVGAGGNYILIDQQCQILELFGDEVVFNNMFSSVLGSVTFTKMKIGGIVEENAGENEFYFDLYQLVEGMWVMINEEPYATSAMGTVTITDLEPGYYRIIERAHDIWTIEQQYVNGIFFTIDEKGNEVWDNTGEEAPVVVNKPILGQSYGSVTATNEGNRNAIVAGLNPKNGNPFYGDKNNPNTPYVVPNSNHFVFAELARADLEKGVILDMMVGNKFEVVGKALVKLTDGQIEITLNGEGTFGSIAFNKIPVFNNGNIHSQNEKSLATYGALTGFSHNNKTFIPCPSGDTMYLYIHCSSIRFYKEILAW